MIIILKTRFNLQTLTRFHIPINFENFDINSLVSKFIPVKIDVSKLKSMFPSKKRCHQVNCCYQFKIDVSEFINMFPSYVSKLPITQNQTSSNRPLECWTSYNLGNDLQAIIWASYLQAINYVKLFSIALFEFERFLNIAKDR